MGRTCYWQLVLLMSWVWMSNNGFVWVRCEVVGAIQPGMMRMELIHMHSPHLPENINKTQRERMQELFDSDTIRHHMVISRLNRTGESFVRRKALDTSNKVSSSSPTKEMWLSSAAEYGAGHYLVLFKIGTPPQAFKLIPDTGSDLTWFKCNINGQKRVQRCGHGGHRPNNKKRNHKKSPSWSSSSLALYRRKGKRPRRLFNPNLSSSYNTIPCSSAMCEFDLSTLFSLRTCPSPLSPCLYEYSYKDDTTTFGFFANETVTVGMTDGGTMKLDNVVIGCSTHYQGLKAADGILGLAYSKHSFALKATTNTTNNGTSNKRDRKFSYCLVDHMSFKNVSSYLRFGGSPTWPTTPSNRNSRQYTPLGVIGSFYAVSVTGISVGGKMLDSIPSEVWDLVLEGGAILDSGTTLTHLAMPAYEPLIAAFDRSFLKSNPNFQRVESPPLDYCFNATTFNESLTPSLVFHFLNGARLVPPVKSYVLNTAEGVQCLGFKPVKWPGVSIIGNIMQQNHVWEFDLTADMLSFAPSPCT